jgi:hypothetical protein
VLFDDVPIKLANLLIDSQLPLNQSHDHLGHGTWIDLEFERLFSSMDSTLTPLGSQCLYHKLRIYRDDPAELENDYTAYQVLRRDSALRGQLQLGLWSLRRDSSARANYLSSAEATRTAGVGLGISTAVRC